MTRQNRRCISGALAVMRKARGTMSGEPHSIGGHDCAIVQRRFRGVHHGYLG